MAFDRTTQKVVLFGGFDTNTYLQDTWLWDGATSTWSQALLTKSPPRATGVMMFTDPKTGRAMMFGGYNANNIVPVYSYTWQWSGALLEGTKSVGCPLPARMGDGNNRCDSSHHCPHRGNGRHHPCRQYLDLGRRELDDAGSANPS